MNDPFNLTRRYFLQGGGAGLGSLALGSLLGSEQGLHSSVVSKPKAKRIIYLFQSGGPSQLDLFDHKPELKKTLRRRSPHFGLPQRTKDQNVGRPEQLRHRTQHFQLFPTWRKRRMDE